jgi:Spy/CpxP family protein refolding chaperone
MNRKLAVICLAVICLDVVGVCGPAWVFGQEPADENAPPPMPEGKAAAIVMSASSDGGPVEIQAFEVSGSGGFTMSTGPIMFAPGMGGMGMFGGGGGVYNNSLNWLEDESMLTELDIIDEQREKLQQLRDEVQKRRQDFGKTVRELPAEKRVDFIREFANLLSANTDEKVNEILLPHQRKRFDQLRLQTQMRNSGAGALENEKLIEQLGITDAQREELKKKRAEVEVKLRKKLDALRKEAQEEMCSVLTQEQRDKLKEMLGREYDK